MLVVYFVVRDYNIECVRYVVVFIVCFLVDVRIGFKLKLRLYCSFNDQRRQLIDKEDEVLLEEESLWEIMRSDDKVYVFFLEDVVRLVNSDYLKGFFFK